MPPIFIGVLLVLIAGIAVVGVMYFIVREEPQHEEYYIPEEEPPVVTASEKTDPATAQPTPYATTGAPAPTDVQAGQNANQAEAQPG